MGISTHKLATTGQDVWVSHSSPPSAGYVLKATSATEAGWAAPGAFSVTTNTLTDNSGGATADGTIGVVTPPAALTDSTTGTPGTTLAVVTNPDLSAWNGTVDPTATQATAIGAAITSIKNAIASLSARQGEDRMAIVALTDAVKELSTGFNALVNDLKS